MLGNFQRVGGSPTCETAPNTQTPATTLREQDPCDPSPPGIQPLAPGKPSSHRRICVGRACSPPVRQSQLMTQANPLPSAGKVYAGELVGESRWVAHNRFNHRAPSSAVIHRALEVASRRDSLVVTRRSPSAASRRDSSTASPERVEFDSVRRQKSPLELKKSGGTIDH